MDNGGEVPKVSVIIPTYNRSVLVNRAIQSVLSQTYKNIEIIVVDDGSTDNTKQMIEESFSGKVKYVFQNKNGAPAARNLGFSLSTGDYINFLDSDDYFLPQNVEVKVKTLEGNNSIGWVYSNSYTENEVTGFRTTHRGVAKFKKILKKKDEIFDIMLFNGITNMNNVMLRKECIEEVNGFDQNLPAFQDVDLFLRVARKFKTQFIDKPLAVRVPQQLSISRNKDDYYRGKLLLVEKVKELFPEETKRLGYPTKKTQAELFNYSGICFLKNNDKKMARLKFIKSIKVHLFQKEAYRWLFKSFFG